MAEIGKKIKITKLTADSSILKEFAAEDYITNRKKGNVIINFPHSFNPDLYICTNTDGNKAIYSVEELKN
jgi:hypothetical protein